jgi:hypothetical protein
LDYYNKQGWGYADSYFDIDDKREKVIIRGIIIFRVLIVYYNRKQIYV